MKEKLKKVSVVCGGALGSAVLPVMCFAAEGDAASVVTAAATTVKTDALAALGAVAPIGIAIGGAYLVYKLGWRFFKGLAK